MRSQLRVTAGLAVGTALLAAGCGPAPAPHPRAGPGQPGPAMARGVSIREPAADPRPYGAADTAFGLDLLGAWCRTQPQANLVMSPSSLASGLGMAYLGARGGTARAMAGVLHLPAAGDPALEAGLQARSAALRGLDGPGVTVAASDQVWTDPALRPLNSYLNAVATGYDAGVAQAPLLTDPDLVTREVNQAIAAATRGHIPQLLPAGSLRGMAWVLTDALYLNAAWATPFTPAQTSAGPFATAAGQRVSAKFMHGGPYLAAAAGGWTGVQLPYRGGKLAMVALLPPSGDSGCGMPGAAALGTITSRLARPGPGGSGPVGPGQGGRGTSGPGGTTSAAIALPRVDLSTHAELTELLSGLGMRVAFTSAADFGGLSPAACCIGLVEHAATLQVGEKGTVASAATAVGMLPSAAIAVSEQVEFDRPYLLMVTDTATGDPLFLARVANPDIG